MIVGVLGQVAAVLGALLFVSVLAWAAIWLMRRFQVQGPGASAAAGELRFVRALPLGPRERLVEVEWRGEILLLGVTAGGVSLVRRGTDATPEP